MRTKILQTRRREKPHIARRGRDIFLHKTIANIAQLPAPEVYLRSFQIMPGETGNQSPKQRSPGRLKAPMFISPIRDRIAALNRLPGNLLRDGVKSAFIHATAHALSLVASVFLARLLGAQGYGVYVYAAAISGLLGMVGLLGAPTLVVRETSVSQARGNWTYLRAMLTRLVQLTTLTTVLLLALSFLVLWFLSARLSARQIETFSWLLLLLPFMVFGRIVSSVLKGMGRVIAGQMIERIVPPALLLTALAFLFVLFPQTRRPEVVAFIRFGVGVVVVCAACFMLRAYLPGEFRRGKMTCRPAQALRGALPFLLISGADLVNTQFDILLLGLLRPIEETGIYRIAAHATIATLFGLQVVNTLIAPQVAKMYAHKDTRQLQRLIGTCGKMAFACALLVSCVLFVFGRDLIILIFGREYSAAYTPMAILLVGVLVRVAVGPVGLVANMTGHERYAVRSLWYGVLLNILLNALFIPAWGMAGAAAATTISFPLHSVRLYFVIKSKTGIKSHVFGGVR